MSIFTVDIVTVCLHNVCQHCSLFSLGDIENVNDLRTVCLATDSLTIALFESQNIQPGAGSCLKL